MLDEESDLLKGLEDYLRLKDFHSMLLLIPEELCTNRNRRWQKHALLRYDNTMGHHLRLTATIMSARMRLHLMQVHCHPQPLVLLLQFIQFAHQLQVHHCIHLQHILAPLLINLPHLPLLQDRLLQEWWKALNVTNFMLTELKQ